MVGVVSDTHDNVSAVERIVEEFEDEGVGTVVHCGDYIAPPVLPFLDTDAFELHGVLGNNDGEIEGLNAGFDAMDGATLHGRFADLTLEGSRFAVLHGESKDEVDALAESDAYDYVLYGHYHVNEAREVEGTTVVNPGAQFPTTTDENRTVASWTPKKSRVLTPSSSCAYSTASRVTRRDCQPRAARRSPRSARLRACPSRPPSPRPPSTGAGRRYVRRRDGRRRRVRSARPALSAS